jgi:hypothetical protein
MGGDQRSSVRLDLLRFFSAVDPKFSNQILQKVCHDRLRQTLSHRKYALNQYFSYHVILSARLTLLARQEKLLQGLMTEIVRMTTQQQPLEVGIPLYPFSHAGVFSKPASGSEEDAGDVHIAPLPISPSYEEIISPPHDSPSLSQSSTSPPITDGMVWVSR